MQCTASQMTRAATLVAALGFCDPSACEEPSFRPMTPVLAPGRHTLVVEARLPGTDIVLETATGSVDLDCPDVDTS